MMGERPKHVELIVIINKIIIIASSWLFILLFLQFARRLNKHVFNKRTCTFLDYYTESIDNLF